MVRVHIFRPLTFLAGFALALGPVNVAHADDDINQMPAQPGELQDGQQMLPNGKIEQVPFVLNADGGLTASPDSHGLDFSSQPVPIPNSMAALGDSISAGALANFKRQDAWLPWVHLAAIFKLVAYGITKDHSVVEKRSFSWTTGDDPKARVVSHARRLTNLNPSRHLNVYNAAISGDEVQDVLDEQLPRLQTWSRKTNGQDSPDYVTLLIGANDICADNSQDRTDQNPGGMTTTADYYDRLNTVMHQLVDKSPNTRVLISSLPNIEKLRETTKSSWLMVWGLFPKCEDLWKITKLCPTLTTLDGPGDRDRIAQRAIDYNQIMKDIAQQINKEHPDHVRVSTKPYDVVFNPDDLSVDCFHPNPIGHNILSKGTWSDSWWAASWGDKEDAALVKAANRAPTCVRNDKRPTQCQ